MEIDIIRIEEKENMNMRQDQFPEYMLKKGYKCIRLITKNYEEIKEILGCDFEKGLGMPDFLVYNSNEKFFCDFKSKNDSWGIKQIEWALRNQHIKLFLAIVSKYKNPPPVEEKKKKEDYTTVQISKKTYKELQKEGIIGDTIESIILKMINSTKDDK